MSISASRFKFLDKETNVPLTDFLSVTNSDTLNAMVDNLALDKLIVPIELPKFNLEDTVKKGMNDVKALLSGDYNLTDKLKELGTELKEYIPEGIDLGQNGMLDNLKKVFNKVSNLSTSSLCDLINFALGISLVSLLFNLSPDMRKRLFMMALLALLYKLCYTKFNDLDNMGSLINKDLIRDTGKKVFGNLVKPNSMGSIDKFLPKGANPLKQVINSVKNTPNPFADKLPTIANPKLSLFA